MSPTQNRTSAHRLDGVRGHQLLPSALAGKLPPIYSQENVADPIVQVKLFSPYTGAVWYLTEYDPASGEAFGWADLGYGMGELGYISIRELEGMNRNGLPLVERDTSWRPVPLSRAKGGRTAASASKYPSVARQVEDDYKRKAITQGERREMLEAIERAESRQDAERVVEQARKGRTAANTRNWTPEQRLISALGSVAVAVQHAGLLAREAPHAAQSADRALKLLEAGEQVLGRDVARDLSLPAYRTAAEGFRPGDMAVWEGRKVMVLDTHGFPVRTVDIRWTESGVPGSKDEVANTKRNVPVNQLSKAAASRTSARYSGDPYWLTAKYPGVDNKGRPFKKGERVFYYPRTKTILTGDDAARAAAEFEAAAFDEDFGYRGASSSRVAYEPPFHNAAEADEALGEAYRALIDLKLGFDSWHEIPSSAHPLYQQIMKAVDAVVTARQVTTQVRAMVARKRY